MERLIAPIFFTVIGAVFFILSINLPRSPLGNPNELTYFPMMIAIMILVLGIVYLIRELKLRKEEFKAFKLVRVPETLKRLIISVLLMLGYTLIFERIGFLISTMLFLGALLFLLNGKSRWKLNIITSVLFAFISWYSFAVLLQVSLP